MKTLTVQLRGAHPTCSYRGTIVYGNPKDIGDIDSWAHTLGYTHIKWLGIPLGRGTQTCKVVA